MMPYREFVYRCSRTLLYGFLTPILLLILLPTLYYGFFFIMDSLGIYLPML